MTNCSGEFKVNVANEHLFNYISYKIVAKKYPGTYSKISSWVNLAESQGLELQAKKNYKTYSLLAALK